MHNVSFCPHTHTHTSFSHSFPCTHTHTHTHIFLSLFFMHTHAHTHTHIHTLYMFCTNGQVAVFKAIFDQCLFGGKIVVIDVLKTNHQDRCDSTCTCAGIGCRSGTSLFHYLATRPSVVSVHDYNYINKSCRSIKL